MDETPEGLETAPSLVGNLLSIKYSDALRQLYGYTDKEDAPDNWDMWLKSIYPEDREYVESSYLL